MRKRKKIRKIKMKIKYNVIGRWNGVFKKKEKNRKIKKNINKMLYKKRNCVVGIIIKKLKN